MFPLSPFRLVDLAFDLYFVILVIRVIGSWAPPGPGQTTWAKVLGVCYALTEPLLAPIRRALQPVQGRSGFDFSPVILLLILSVVRAILFRLL
jgi:YggT family protein